MAAFIQHEQKQKIHQILTLQIAKSLSSSAPWILMCLAPISVITIQQHSTVFV